MLSAHVRSRHTLLYSKRILTSLTLVILTTWLLLMGFTATAQGAPADLSAAGGLPSMQTAAPTGRIVVRLAYGNGLAMGSQGLQTRPSLLPNQMSAVNIKAQTLSRLVEQLVPGGRLETRFPGRTVPSLQVVRNQALPDLTRYAHLETSGLDRDQLLRLVARLNADPMVDLAFLEPKTVPAALGFNAFTGTYTPPEGSINKSGASPAATPNYESLQGYLGAPPNGINALNVRALPGGRGAGVTVVDVEGAWLWAHEDLPAPVLDLNVHYTDISWRNHGTAVLAEVRGIDNGYGVTGIAPDCDIGASSIGNWRPTSVAIVAAADALDPGDIILIELHSPGPRTFDESQFGYMPMEFWQDVFDAIQYATFKGLIVCEAAGNGYQDLDDPLYQGFFDRTIRDSGAIMCGATNGSALEAADFSNHGERVDLNGWGRYVCTAAYGDLQGGDETVWYTNYFSGTSSASPIVVGAVADIQAMARAQHGIDLDARLARDILRTSGTAMTGGHLIGNRPNLVNAYVLANASVGAVAGTVTDLDSGLPLEGVLVSVDGEGSFTATDALGQWRLPLMAGANDLTFYSFYHEAQTHAVTIVTGATGTLDVQLSELDLVNLTGQVHGVSSALPNVVVTCINQPIPGTLSDGSGYFTISGVPIGHTYKLLFDGISGFGPRLEAFQTVYATGDVTIDPLLPAIEESFESDGGGFTATQGIWSWDIPPAGVVTSAFDGTRCWGVGMSGSYADDVTDTLTSPVYDLSGVSEQTYFLGFHYYSATEGQYDGVNLEASSGGAFELLFPMTLYTDVTIDGLSNTTGWSGQSGRWTGAVFDISAYIGGDFTFRLNFGSDQAVFEQGFYVDGIVLGQGLVASSAPVETLPALSIATLEAWPNPFNPRLNLAYALDRPGSLDVGVFDMRGRRITTVFAGEVADTRGTLSWDGRMTSGRSAPSGVYLVRLRGDTGVTAVQRVVLAR
jgi:Subtilase family/Carboxypeptidase regulatory-like domain/Immune inhibitor A-like, MAM domain